MSSHEQAEPARVVGRVEQRRLLDQELVRGQVSRVAVRERHGRRSPRIPGEAVGPQAEPVPLAVLAEALVGQRRVRRTWPAAA